MLSVQVIVILISHIFTAAKNSKGEYDHVYHEPGDAGYREYSEPCTEYDYSGAEYKVGSAADSTIPVKGRGNP